MKIGTTTALYINQLLKLAHSLGSDIDQLLADAELDPNELEDDDNRVDLTFLMRLGRGAIRQTGRQEIGLLMGHHSTLSGSGYVGLAAMTSATLQQALTVLTQFEHLNSQCYRGTSALLSDEPKPVLSFYSIAPYNAYTCFVVDGVLTAWVKLIYLLTGRSDLVEHIQIEFDTPSYVDAYREAFSCPVRFGCERNALVLTSEALQTPVLESNAGLHQKLIRQCERQLNEIALADSYRNKVLKVLGTMLHGQTPSIDEVALKLGMPSWTLRRKLKEEDSAYQLLVDEMRRDVAMSYMRNTDLTFGEISYLLGFSTPGAFQRAFKRWSGQTPGEYRKSLSSKRK
ncbi:AraC family transcriptional regulator [Ketobacter sp. MCCC 1A13808]|uniref:AraC family transcriptional regulator n=1 Tax=Ketobacter sp. MCCC 1A13808 TaxID=2602738 RepID=UPI000F1C141E|nr:AraC family transcriptional regulator [Ketobacter sp. MCCC 1A13808]MVF14405.1 AraC family transcriptional regulator [Ketobacter sp. MCCC 1A13808]RLP52228.1 MAG: AraC family transcriptional regulator [Ketobacter sp.]